MVTKAPHDTNLKYHTETKFDSSIFLEEFESLRWINIDTCWDIYKNYCQLSNVDNSLFRLSKLCFIDMSPKHLQGARQKMFIAKAQKRCVKFQNWCLGKTYCLNVEKRIHRM